MNEERGGLQSVQDLDPPLQDIRGERTEDAEVAWSRGEDTSKHREETFVDGSLRHFFPISILALGKDKEGPARLFHPLSLR